MWATASRTLAFSHTHTLSAVFPNPRIPPPKKVVCLRTPSCGTKKLACGTRPELPSKFFLDDRHPYVINLPSVLGFSLCVDWVTSQQRQYQLPEKAWQSSCGVSQPPIRPRKTSLQGATACLCAKHWTLNPVSSYQLSPARTRVSLLEQREWTTKLFKRVFFLQF